MIVEAIQAVAEGQHLSREQAAAAMSEIMEGRATDAQIAALITGLRVKGETVEEISGFAQVMREKATPVTPEAAELVDTCGTGGDSSGTFNISTTAAFVVAGAGVHVAKHGNRCVSSQSGSADVLEALGVVIDLPPDAVASCVDEAGIGFLFAPSLHQAMKHAMGPRKEIGIRTVFNILGPLTNPASACSQVLGVYSPFLTETMAKVLRNLGTRHALVVHGADGLDELSTTGQSLVSELVAERVDTYTVSPEQVGLARASLEDLKGGDASTNADITRAILSGEAGPRRDIVLVNAAAALVAADRVSSITEGLELAAESVDSGAALDRLERLVAHSQRLAS